MLTLCFEDRLVVDEERYIGISYLLKQACENFLRCKIVFSETNCSILDKAIESVNNNDDFVLAFLDVVVDNKNSTLLYQQYISGLIANNITNIILLPIPCIEFYFVNAFSNLVSDKGIVEQMLNLQATSTFKLQNGRQKSFEKVCKKIVSGYMPIDACKTSFYKNKLSFFNGYYGIVDEPCDYFEKCKMFVCKLLEVDGCGNVQSLLFKLTNRLVIQAKKYEATLTPLERECTSFEYLTKQQQYLEYLNEYAKDVININLGCTGTYLYKEYNTTVSSPQDTLTKTASDILDSIK